MTAINKINGKFLKLIISVILVLVTLQTAYAGVMAFLMLYYSHKVERVRMIGRDLKYLAITGFSIRQIAGSVRLDSAGKLRNQRRLETGAGDPSFSHSDGIQEISLGNHSSFSIALIKPAKRGSVGY